MNGYEAAWRIKQANPEIQIIAISALGGRGWTYYKGIMLGFSDYLVKPFNTQELVERIRGIGKRHSIPHTLLETMYEAVGFVEGIWAKDLARIQRQEEEIKSLKSQISGRKAKQAPEVASDEDTNLLLNALLHRLGNTIVPVREILRLAKQSANPRTYLEMMESNVDRALDVVQQLQMPSVPWEIRPTDLEKVIESAKKQLPIPDNVHIEVTIHEQARTISSNSQALVIVFMNLMTNAIQAMEDGGTLIVESQLTGDERVEIRLTDTGYGISTDLQASLFEPFFTTRKKQGGQGLGLWLSKRLVERVGGTLVLEYSEPGAGSTFLLSFPLTTSKNEGSERRRSK